LGYIFGVLGLHTCIMPFYKSPLQQKGTNLRLAPINFLVRVCSFPHTITTVKTVITPKTPAQVPSPPRDWA